MTSLSRVSGTRSVPMPKPAARRLRPEDVVGLLGANVALIVLMWVRHGGLDRLGTVADVAIGVGQVTALLGTFLMSVASTSAIRVRAGRLGACRA